MATSTISISLPEPLRAYVESQIERGSYGTPGDYIRELILDDRARHRARIEDQLEMAESEETVEISDGEWETGDIMGMAHLRLSERS